MKEHGNKRNRLTYVIISSTLVFVICGCILIYQTTRKAKSSSGKRSDNSLGLTVSVGITEQVLNDSLVNTENVGDPVLAAGEIYKTYMVLDNLIPSTETIRLLEEVQNRLVYIDYTKVKCNVRYTNHPHNEYIYDDITGRQVYDSLYDISEVYIPKESANELISHDSVMICVIRKTIDDQPKFFSVCDENANAEFLRIDCGVVQISESVSLENSYAFHSIWILNNYLDMVNSTIDLEQRKPTEREKKLPKKGFSDGMSIQDVIDFFEAYNEWNDYSDGSREILPD